MKSIQSFFLASAFFILSACSNLALPTPQSTSQDLAYAYGALAGIRTTAAQMLQSGQINVQQAQEVLATTDQARAILDAGEAAVTAGQSANAETALQQATTLLNTLQGILNVTTSKPAASAAQ